jgi:hypothetical protein
MASLTLRERIMQQVVSTLTTALSGVQVDRGRDTPVETYPSVVVVEGSHTIEHDNHGAESVFMDFGCELYIESATTAALNPALNALYGAVVAALLADPSVNNLAFFLAETTMDAPEPLRGEGQAPTMGATVGFTVQYYRAEGDPFSLGAL